ncbi:MAG TPA: GNAT family N-acetyltransferase [Acidimicrobiia bacterium]
MRSLSPVELKTDRLLLTPLKVEDAAEMVSVLADPDLYGFTGDSPPSLEVLEHRYRAQVIGPPRKGELWHNWILRLAGPETAIGFVQATVIGDSAELAWVVGTAWQGHGYATEGAKAMRDWLAEVGTTQFTAHIHPDHEVSGRVATGIGLRRTDEVDPDGEVIWVSAV